MRFKIILSLAVLLLCVSVVVHAQAPRKAFVEDELTIQFARDAMPSVKFRSQGGVALTGLSGVDALNAKYQVSKVELLTKFELKNKASAERTGLDRFHVIKVPLGTDIEAMALEYEQDPQIERAYPNYYVKAHGVDSKKPRTQLVPNDTFYGNQWGLNNTGQADPFGGGAPVGTPGADINAEAAWDITTGDGTVLIGIIDTGVDYNHPEFAGRTVAGWDFENNDSDPMDDNGHGTACAGIAAAAGNNGFGVAGVSWGAMIMPIKFLDSGGFGSFANGAASITFGVDNGCDILSNSWGSTTNDAAVAAAVEYAHDNGVLFVASRGNGNSSTVNYPGSYADAMSVIALSPCNERKTTVTCDGEFWWGSSFGNDSDVSAPGTRIWTTDILGGGGFDGGDYFAEMNGTSAACPFVAGIAALVMTNEPGLTHDQVRDRINSTAVDIDAPGFDANTGWGRADAFAALTNGGGGSSPVVTDIPDQTITDGGAFATINLDDFVSDGDHADSDMTWSTSGGSSISVSIDANRVATVSYTGIASETITFTATDPDGNSDSDGATFTVNAAGGSDPVVSDIADETVAEGDRITYSMNDFVDDPDTDDADITWTWSGNSLLTVQYRSATQQIRVTVPTGFAGSETITFTATDPEGNSDSDAATYSTAGGGTDPVVSDIPNQTIDDGDSFADINLDDFVDDPDHADSDMSWSTSGGTDVSVSIDANRVASITYTGGWTGSESITFTATDPDGNSDSDAASFTVNTIGGGGDPVVSDIPDHDFAGANATVLSMNDHVDDPDHADSEITWSWTGNTDLIVIYRSTTQQIRVRRPAGWTGSETITFTATDPDGNSDSDDATFSEGAAQISANGSTVEISGVPETMVLERNYPNPFNPSTSIVYGLNEGNWVTLKIYNSLGQEIRTLVNEYQSAGYQTVVWNGRDDAGRPVSSGIYIYRMTAGDFSKTHKMVFSK